MFKLKSLALIALVVAAIAAAPLTTASAATTKTVSITEAQINATNLVSEPYRQRVTNLKVDLQEGQAVVTASVQPRRDAPAYETVTTFVPAVRNGRLDWTITTRLRDGKDVPAEVLALLNNAVFPRVKAYVNRLVREKVGGPYKVDSVTISADTLTVQYTVADKVKK